MLDAVANFADLVAALAVIGSLIYLAVQVRQAAGVARVEAHYQFTQSVLAILGDVAKDPELHRIWRSGLLEEQPLNDLEKDRLGMILYQLFGAYSAAHEAALIDTELTELSRMSLDNFLATPGVQKWWKRHGANFLESFQALVNARISELERHGK